MTSRRLLASLALLAAVTAAFWTAAPASADPVDDATAALRSSAVYVADGATNGYDKKVNVDQSAVSSAAGSSVKIAILPEGISTKDAVNNGIGPGLNLTNSTVFVAFSGNKFYAGSNHLQPGLANSRLTALVSANAADLKAGQYTNLLVTYSSQMVQLINSSGSGSNDGGDTSLSSSSSSSGGSSAWPWIAGIGGAVVLGGGGYVYSRRRKAKKLLDEAKANVMPYYDRLANEVNTINVLDNKTAQQAMADASERYTAAGSQMATAETVQNWSVVRRTTMEGLQATQLARKELGLPPGPDLPPIEESTAEQLTAAQTVTVQGQQYQGYPQYTPGAPYYYGGGGGYAGGWYSFPFWETLLIGSALGGGLGGWGWGGGGYGAGYDSGYDAGRDSAQNDNNSGGGDFGGFSGGGDFGGGGGDFGGGGGDGGSF